MERLDKIGKQLPVALQRGSRTLSFAGLVFSRQGSRVAQHAQVLTSKHESKSRLHAHAL